MKITITKLSLLCVSLIVISLMFVGQSSARIDPETIAGMWLFDDGTGKVAKDASLNGNDGEILGSPKWVKGKFGMALEFDGQDDWVNMGDNPILKPETNGKGDVTFICWYIKYEKTFHKYVLSSGAQTSSTGIAITHEPDDKIWFGAKTLKKSATGTFPLPKREVWHHLAGSYDDAKGQLTCYIDGKVAHTIKATEEANQNSHLEFHVGKPNNVADYFLKGIIDELALFNVALLEDDILTIMTKGLEYAVLAVSEAGKLTTTWGFIKNEPSE